MCKGNIFFNTIAQKVKNKSEYFDRLSNRSTVSPITPPDLPQGGGDWKIESYEKNNHFFNR